MTENLDNIEEELDYEHEGERCTFTDSVCDPRMSALVLVSSSHHVRLKFCECCLMGKLIREIRLLSARGQ